MLIIIWDSHARCSSTKGLIFSSYSFYHLIFFPFKKEKKIQINFYDKNKEDK